VRSTNVNPIPVMNTLISIVVVAVSLYSPAFADEVRGRVVAIADGDTLTILDANKDQHRILLAGIDAPEKNQPFGNQSKDNLSRLVHSKAVVADCYKIDRYQRRICRVHLDGVDIPLAQVTSGLAWWYRTYSSEQTPVERADYERAEASAVAAHGGLWGETNPIPPWEWRKSK
jgi:endonuclease YncB( thermonuclease family)